MSYVMANISADYTIKVAKVFQQNWQKTELISMIIKMIKKL